LDEPAGDPADPGDPPVGHEQQRAAGADERTAEQPEKPLRSHTTTISTPGASTPTGTAGFRGPRAAARVACHGRLSTLHGQPSEAHWGDVNGGWRGATASRMGSGRARDYDWPFVAPAHPSRRPRRHRW